MKLIKKITFFLTIVWRNWYYPGIDKYHLVKYRISIKTAWKVTKIF